MGTVPMTSMYRIIMSGAKTVEQVLAAMDEETAKNAVAANDPNWAE